MTVPHAFDWYQASIPAPPKAVVDVFLADFPEAHDVQHSDRGGNGFKASSLIRDREGDTLAIIRHGGNPQPNVQLSSHNATPGASLIRKHWPDHRVSRADVACDFAAGETLYDTLVDQCRVVADTRNIYSGREIRPDHPIAGRCWYLGKPTSNVMLRAYEKGLEQRAKGVADAPEDWVRLELQVRPQKDGKSTVALLSPDQLWGSSRWSRDVAAIVLKHDADRINIDPRQEPDWKRLMAHLVHQYRASAIDIGARLATNEHGLIDPTDRDAIAMFCDHLRDDMIREHEARYGIPVTAIFPVA